MDTQNICVDFSCLFDTDYGVIGYLIYSCPKSVYFLQGYRDWTEYYAKCKILSRMKISPLSALLKEEYQDQADNLYKEILDKHWTKILNLTKQTNILKLINQTYDQSGYRITVKCRNELECNHIKKYVNKWDTIIENDNKEYFCYFIHDLDSRLVELGKLNGKSIYIYYHKPNFLNYKEKIPNNSLMPYALTNIIKIISPYDIVFPYDMTPLDMEVEGNGATYSIK